MIIRIIVKFVNYFRFFSSILSNFLIIVINLTCLLLFSQFSVLFANLKFRFTFYFILCIMYN